MDYFNEDGPQAIPNAPKQEEDINLTKDRYFKHFMIDFMEFGLRKVAT